MLAGRAAERERLVALLTASAAGRGAPLVLHGLPGAGKSALLDEVVATCPQLDPPVHVLRTTGIESESPLAYAALQRLLRPAMPLIDRLPAPQSDALRVAFGEKSGTSDRFVVFLASLSLLAELAAEHPVLVVVDDAHWLDDASAAALQFVARRIESERIALLFGARDGDLRRFEMGDLPVLRVGGLDEAGTAQLLCAHSGIPVPDDVAAVLHEQTGGNPLALVEIARALSPAALSGSEPLPAVLPLTDGVEAAYLTRYREMPATARTWLLVAAADDSSRETVVAAAAEALGADDDAIDAVERSDLARLRNGKVELRHPLVRSSVYGAATSAERRRVHRALADALVASGDLDRRAWHLAAAVDQPDAEVVAALDDVAERAASRGGHEAAAAAWTRAAALTSASGERGRRYLQASSSALQAGHPAQALTLANAAAAEGVAPEVKVRILTLQAQIAWNTRSLDEGYDLVLQAAELAARDAPDSLPPLAMLSTSLAAFGAHSGRAFDPVRELSEPGAEAPVQTRLSYQLLHGFHALARNDYATANKLFQGAFELAGVIGVDADHVLQPNLGIAAWLIDDDERTLRLHDQQLTAARRAGALNMVEHALTRGFKAHIALGSWSKAASTAAEALSLTSATGQRGMTALPLAELALVAALRGQDDADSLLVDATAVIDTNLVGITEGIVVDKCRWARGLRAGAQPDRALQEFEKIQLPTIRRMVTLDVFDASLRAGRPEAAAPWLADMMTFADGTGSAAAAAVVEHGLALFAGDGSSETHFRNSLAAHDGSARLPERARTQLAFGEYLRRERRRVDAREQLRNALALFEDIGAAPWAERAAQELRASGETARRREVGSADQLTTQERQVSGLVRQGLSNRDVAAQLFVSPRTVDFHLRNVFRKLGVTSRSELMTLTLDV